MSAFTDYSFETFGLQDSMVDSLVLAQRRCQIAGLQARDEYPASSHQSLRMCDAAHSTRYSRYGASLVGSSLPSRPNSSVLFSPRPHETSTKLCLSSLDSLGDLMLPKAKKPQRPTDLAESFEVNMNSVQTVPALLDPTEPVTAPCMSGSVSAQEPNYCEDFQQLVVDLLERWECQFTRALARVDQVAEAQAQINTRLDTLGQRLDRWDALEQRLDRLEATMASTPNPSLPLPPQAAPMPASARHTALATSDYLADLQERVAVSAELIQRQDDIIVELEERLATQTRTMEAERVYYDRQQHHSMVRWRESSHAMEGLKADLRRTERCLADRDAALVKIQCLVHHILNTTPDHHSSSSSTALASSFEKPKFSPSSLGRPRMRSSKSLRSRQGFAMAAAEHNQSSTTQSSQPHRQSDGSL
ncbi:hypothetical protein H4R34_005137 [Dimargaris verticillata]|uniref:Uncharacterized protein n=1 Tax=Dimargaris verticillata TaxID=2761393 RepID=A0A9W8B3I2_9FUNG|nr:hypothetical protein H4R34_005137 [Dimargaris verticillata]